MNTNLIVRCLLSGLLTTGVACLGEDSTSDNPEDLFPDADSSSAPTPSSEKGERPPTSGRKDAGVFAPGFEKDAGAKPPEDCWPEPPPPELRDAGKPGLPPDGGVPVDAAAPSQLACSGRGIGSPTACLTYEEAEQRLVTECARDGLELTDVTQKGDVDCKPGTSHQAWGTCCPAPTQPLEDCWFESIQNKVCTPPERLQERAEKSCATQGAYVPWLEAEDDECAGPAFKGAVYQCCPDPGVPYPL